MPPFDGMDLNKAVLYGPDGSSIQWNGISNAKIDEEVNGEEEMKPFARLKESAEASFTVECSKIANRKAIKFFRKQSNIIRRRVRYLYRFKERRRRAALKGEKYIRISRKYVIMFNPLVFKED